MGTHKKLWPQQFGLIAAALVLTMGLGHAADKKYAPGITDTEIKFGQTEPYSGPLSSWSQNGVGDQAFMKYINDKGGINGRKLVLISLDDGYNPAKALEQTRKLVEEENVAFLYRSLGTAPQLAVQKYLNEKQVPQLLLASGASKFNDPQHYPWSVGYVPFYDIEGEVYGRYILENLPNAKIAVLYQDDDLGKDHLKGLKKGLGAKAGMIVAEASYELSDPTVDSQITTLQASGADVFVNFSAAKFASMAIRKTYDIGWKPTQFLMGLSASTAVVLAPAGLDKSIGIIAAAGNKDPMDPQWANDAELKTWNDWMDQYNTKVAKTDFVGVGAWNSGWLLVEILKRCGDDLSRENILYQTTHLKDVTVPMMLPGITISSSPTDYRLIRGLQLEKFDGKQWVLFGKVMTAAGS